MGTSPADAKTITITCTASNNDAVVSSVDATDAVIKIFRLTIPAYKITLTPPTGLATDPDAPAGSTVYLVTNGDLTSTSKQFTLTVEPEDAADSFPTGTEFSWKFGTADWTTASGDDDSKNVTIGTMCNLTGAGASVPEDTTGYTISCRAILTGAATPAVHPATATVKLKKKPPIGSKDAPDAVGDIVFTDGSAMPYSEFAVLDATTQNVKKDAAIALIFDAANMLGVGLKHGSGLLWCTSSARGLYRITAIECSKRLISGVYNFSGDTDGSDNLEQIAADLGSSNDTTDATIYPAFYFAKNYKDTAANLAGTAYETGWYLPSLAELYRIYANGKGANKLFDIDAAFGDLGGATFGSQWFWSSSQYDDDEYIADDYHAYTLDFSGIPKAVRKNNPDGYPVSTCAIRKFN